MLKNIGILTVALSLSACSSFSGTNDEHSAMCKQLKNGILMNGATTNPLKAQQERSELPGLDKSYRDEGCE